MDGIAEEDAWMLLSRHVVLAETGARAARDNDTARRREPIIARCCEFAAHSSSRDIHNCEMHWIYLPWVNLGAPSAVGDSNASDAAGESNASGINSDNFSYYEALCVYTDSNP